MMRGPAVIESRLAIEWSVAARALAGQPVSGDTHAVAPIARGVVVAVVDGLGHGSAAAAVAEVAAATVKAHADATVTDIVLRCHEALRGTRGAALSIASFDAGQGTMTWTGIGNVDGSLLRAAPSARPAREALLLFGGVVGYSLPRLRSATLSVSPGDTLILATDGIGSGFRRGSIPEGSAQDMATDILLRNGKDTDDALVLVARYVGVR
jgi:negative regulator of sigma-B (phosphoserine phosphatase)